MEFRLFGEVTAVGDGGEFGLGNGRPTAVLALLLLEPGRVVSVDRLVDELWGEDPPAKGVHAVRVYVSRLRASLSEGGFDEPVVVAESGGYLANVQRSAVDILRFEDLISEAAILGEPELILARLDEALGLWNGAPLAGFAYDEFAIRTRRRLDEARLDASERWAESALDADRASDVVSFLAPLLQEHQFRERLWASLAIALYREQRQTDALRAIETARSALEEVGLEIGPRLAELESSILLHDPTLGPRRDPPHNLPSPVDAFIGRGREVSQIDETLRSSRLVTMVGPGGCGKTRLGVEAAWHMLDAFDGRVWLVDLATVDSAEAVQDTTIETLGIGPWSRKEPALAAAEVIGDRRALLVLDNCEHVLGGVARFVGEVLRRCPELRVLTTTREPLRMPGESVITVPSLPVPPEGTPPTELGEFEAAALFLDRMNKADQSFELTDDNAQPIVDIVRMLDGIPLAIELAAVRVRTLPLPEIARHLDHLLGTLGVGSRTALPRHRTLEAALDWSVELLEDDEANLFSQLGVLRSSFGLDAATAVANGESETHIELMLSGLVEKSMILNIGDDEPRYRLLEPIRQYATTRLLETGKAPETERRRDDFFSALAEEAGKGDRKFEDPQWRHRFGRERPNLLTSVESLLSTGKTDRAAAMTATIARYWLELGLYDEGKRLIREVLRAKDPASAEMRLELLVGGAFLGIHQGDYDTAEEWANEALSVADRSGSPDFKAKALNALGSLAAERGNMRLAAARLSEGRQMSGPGNPAVYGMVTINLAAVSAWAGRPTVTERLIEELKHLAGAQTLALYLPALRGLTARMRGDLFEAGIMLDQAIKELDERGSAFHLAVFRVERALVAFEEGDWDHARHLTKTVLNKADIGTPPLWAGMKARILAARLAIAEETVDVGRAVLSDAIDEAEASGTLGIVAEAADVAGGMVLAAGDGDRAAALIHGSTALRAEIEFARDPWETRAHARMLSLLDEADPEGPEVPGPGALTGIIRRAIRTRERRM